MLYVPGAAMPVMVPEIVLLLELMFTPFQALSRVSLEAMSPNLEVSDLISP